MLPSRPSTIANASWSTSVSCIPPLQPGVGTPLYSYHPARLLREVVALLAVYEVDVLTLSCGEESNGDNTLRLGEEDRELCRLVVRDIEALPSFPQVKVPNTGVITALPLFSVKRDWWGIVLPVWLIPTILARSSGLFRAAFPPWSPLALQILDSKARCVAPTALLLHKGNSENLLHLLSKSSSEVLFSPLRLEQLHCFQLGTWRQTCRGRKRSVQAQAWKGSSYASLSPSFLPIVHWLGNVRLFYMLMLKWAGWAACEMEKKAVLLLSILLLFLQLCRLIHCWGL